MIELNEFLDLCKGRTNTASDSNLARKVDITRAALSAYRKGVSFPSDANMVKLAKRAKLDVGECLLLLNVWRAEGEAREVYRGMLERLFPKSEFL
jgi:transcriptional regulator with XRE-family HTH domain